MFLVKGIYAQNSCQNILKLSMLSFLGQEENRKLVKPQAKKLLKPSGHLLIYSFQGFWDNRNRLVLLPDVVKWVGYPK